MPKFRHAQGHTYFELLGKKREALPLVCLHGGPGGTHYYFKPMKDLSKTRQVLIYDQIGSGRSSELKARQQKIETFVRDLKRILKKLKIERFHLLGTSWGGTLALEYYLRTGGQGVESLIFQSPLISTKIWSRDAKKLMSGLSKKHQRVIKICLDIGATDSKVYKEAEKAYYAKHVYRGKPKRQRELYLKKFPNDHGNKIYINMWGPSEFVATGSLKRYERAKALKKIRVPTLFIRGEHDEVTRDTMRFLGKQVAGSQITTIKRSSHAILSENPKAMIREVSRFVSGVEQ